MIIFSTSLCVVFWSFEVFSLDAYFLGWSNWWDPWLLRTPEKYILDSHMNLRAFLLWCVLATYILCSCFLSMFIVPLGFVCLDVFMKDHMVIVRGSNLLVLKFGFSVYHFAPCFFAIWCLHCNLDFIRHWRKVVLKYLLASLVISSKVALLMWHGFYVSPSNCSLLFVLAVVGSF